MINNLVYLHNKLNKGVTLNEEELETNEPVSNTATELELYREYASAEIANENDFDVFSVWKEKNKEILN